MTFVEENTSLVLISAALIKNAKKNRTAATMPSMTDSFHKRGEARMPGYRSSRRRRCGPFPSSVRQAHGVAGSPAVVRRGGWVQLSPQAGGAEAIWRR
jgi:hypothetical protein